MFSDIVFVLLLLYMLYNINYNIRIRFVTDSHEAYVAEPIDNERMAMESDKRQNKNEIKQEKKEIKQENDSENLAFYDEK